MFIDFYQQYACLSYNCDLLRYFLKLLTALLKPRTHLFYLGQNINKYALFTEDYI